jgi:hypothetical protein
MPPDPHGSLEFRIPDPVLGWVLKPNTSYLEETPEGIVQVTYNPEGWRDVEHTVPKPDGVFRILVLGDSFMEANSVELNAAFPRRRALARAAGSNTEVINVGCPMELFLKNTWSIETLGDCMNLTWCCWPSLTGTI